MKFILAVVCVVAVLLCGVQAKPRPDTCLTHVEMASISGALDYSDETINYIFWGIVGGTMDTKTFIADIESLYATNNAIRWNLGLPQH